MDICINPGAGLCPTGSWEQAYENIRKFIEDCEIPMHLVRCDFIPDDGRYLFEINADDFDFNTEIAMPGLSIESVRFMGDAGQNIWNFPRLYVDGSSWVWKYAVITKSQVIDSMKTKAEDMEYDLTNIRTQIGNLKGEAEC